MLLESGYFGLTMDRLAEKTECPKGTMYERFACKEDLILALAVDCLKDRLAMMRRAAAYHGRPRERVVAIGEALALQARLHPDDSRILHTSLGPIREKAPEPRQNALIAVESETMSVVRDMLRDAVAVGDLVVQDEGVLDEILFALWALVEGSFTLIESNAPRSALGIENPFTRMFRAFNTLADGYGWRPLFVEQDWEEILAEIRRTIFPAEAQELFGEGCWYGDRG
jgi:AcrR family transcriptional regulator